jgi:polyferredoxin
MDKMNYPRGLVRYTTEHSLNNQTTHVLRPRMFVYAALILLLIVGLVTSMVLRTPIILDVIRDRNSLYRELPNDVIENIYTIKIINQSNDPRQFGLTVTGIDGISLDGVAHEIRVEGGGVLSLPVRVRAARSKAHGVNEIDFLVTAQDDETITVVEDSRFIGP